jgi:hypothetical protein
MSGLITLNKILCLLHKAKEWHRLWYDSPKFEAEFSFFHFFSFGGHGGPVGLAGLSSGSPESPEKKIQAADCF